MVATSWLKQDPAQPLFPDIVWSRPENRQSAGKLLIIGGNLYSFSYPAAAYAEAEVQGIGAVRVLLPAALKPTVSKTFPAAEYAPSTSSGSFAQSALGEWFESSAWADAVLIVGNLGKNSETAILVEKFVSKFHGPLAMAGDAVDFFQAAPDVILNRPETSLVTSLESLQKMALAHHFTEAFTSGMGLVRLTETLGKFSQTIAAAIVLNSYDVFVVARSGQVSSTPQTQPLTTAQIAAATTTWWLQNSARQFEAMTSAFSTKA